MNIDKTLKQEKERPNLEDIQKTAIAPLNSDTDFVYQTGTEFNIRESTTFYPQGTQLIHKNTATSMISNLHATVQTHNSNTILSPIGFGNVVATPSRVELHNKQTNEVLRVTHRSSIALIKEENTTVIRSSALDTHCNRKDYNGSPMHRHVINFDMKVGGIDQLAETT